MPPAVVDPPLDVHSLSLPGPAGGHGNKRAALASCLIFLRENGGLPVERLEVDAWESLVLDVAASVIDRNGATERLRLLLEKF